MKTLYILSTTDEHAFNRLVRASAGLGPFTMIVSAPPLVGRDAPGVPGGMFGTTIRPGAAQAISERISSGGVVDAPSVQYREGVAVPYDKEPTA